MAGDWIKLEHATLDKPEIGIAAELLGISDGDAFLLFLRYWVWLDQNLDEMRHGLVPFVSRKSLERKFKCAGFAAILERIGWASFDDEAQILTVANWERHNGKTAKSRASEQKRKALQRSNVSRFCPASDGTKTVLEKRREESKEKPLRKAAQIQPDGWLEFWISYPRKKDKQKALAEWRKLDPDVALRQTIAGALAWQTLSDDWVRGYIPHPTTYLKGMRWEDEPANKPKQRVVL